MAYFVRYDQADGTFSAKALMRYAPDHVFGLGRTLYLALDDLELKLLDLGSLEKGNGQGSRPAVLPMRFRTVSHPLVLASITVAAALLATLVFLRK